MGNYSVYIAVFWCFSLVASFACAETATTTISVTPAKQCADMTDNDGDSFIDYPSDPGCASSVDDDETDPAPPQCADSADNDLDGFIDYPSDAGCSSALDDDETDPVVPSSSGGGTSFRGGGMPVVSFAGFAFPEASIDILQDGERILEGTALRDGSFSITGTEMTPGSYVFTVIAEKAERRSTVTFLTTIVRSSNTSLRSIFLPPALAAEPISGNLFRVSGVTMPGAEVAFLQGSDRTVLGETVAKDDGTFEEEFVVGESFQIAAASSVLGFQSVLSPFIRAVGIPEEVRGDINKDGKVDLVDFSILVYWLDVPNAPSLFDLSADGSISLEDISVLLFYWTG